MSQDNVILRNSEASQWCDRIRTAWQKGVQHVIDVGRLIIEAKAALPHGEFEAMVEADLPFGTRTAQMLMSISADKRLTKAKHASLLPPSWMTLYELTKLPDEVFDAAIADGTINPGMERREAASLQNRALKQSKVVLPDGRFDVIVMDPPWPMEKIERDVRPNQVDFDYPTMDEDELLAYRGEVDARVADDCHMFMWTTHKFLPLALRLLEAWEFRYICNFTWHKPGGFQPIGLPQYNCEFALYARRGTPKFIDTKGFPCCFEAPRREHSRKPDEFYATVARVTAGRRADWFARGQREGFEVIGNEVEKFSNVEKLD